MNQENKDLLLQDLCARLPYKVQASYYGAEEECECWDEVEGIVNDYVEIGQYSLPIEAVKPYLFPLSSLTEEQRIMLEDWDMNEPMLDISGERQVYIAKSPRIIDWFNANHFDYRGLIPIGLAIDCTNLNIY